MVRPGIGAFSVRPCTPEGELGSGHGHAAVRSRCVPAFRRADLVGRWPSVRPRGALSLFIGVAGEVTTRSRFGDSQAVASIYLGVTIGGVLINTALNLNRVVNPAKQRSG